MADKTYQEYLEHADAYKVIGSTDLWLHHSYGTQAEDVWLKDLPWEFATDVSNGGSYRYSQPISYTVKAEHPSGLTFHWSFAVEDDHSGSVNLNYARIRTVMYQMPIQVREKFRVLLLQNYLDALKQLKEYQEGIEKYQARVDRLEEIVFEITKP